MNTLSWIYLINAILLIIHEIDSAYWKEWELFKLPGGLNAFLFLHFPILFLFLYGLLEIQKQSSIGSVISLLLGSMPISSEKAGTNSRQPFLNFCCIRL
jgi:hypothetical protein